MDTRGGKLGGGEILQIIGKSQKKGTWYVDYILERSFLLMPYIRVIITALLMLLIVIVVMRSYNIKRFGKSHSIKSEMRNVNEIKRRDRAIIRRTNALKAVTKFIEATPFKVYGLKKEYTDYRLARAGLMAPGGYRTLKAEEFNGICKTIQLMLFAMSIVTMLFKQPMIGVLCLGLAVIVCSVLPDRILSKIVVDKDNEIRSNFSEMYLMIHYTLISGAQTPLDRVLRSYGRTTTSSEMQRFVSICCNRIDTYGEYDATKYISSDYREIAEVVKLMRLVRQLREGADIQEELIGFREELLVERKFALERKGDRLVAIANKSMILVWIVLVQVIATTTMIYLPDLGIMTGAFGG